MLGTANRPMAGKGVIGSAGHFKQIRGGLNKKMFWRRPEREKSDIWGGAGDQP